MTGGGRRRDVISDPYDRGIADMLIHERKMLLFPDAGKIWRVAFRRRWDSHMRKRSLRINFLDHGAGTYVWLEDM